MLPRLVIGDIGPLMSKFPSNTWYLEEVSADGGTNSEFLPLWTVLLFEYTSERQTQILRCHLHVLHLDDSIEFSRAAIILDLLRKKLTGVTMKLNTRTLLEKTKSRSKHDANFVLALLAVQVIHL